MPFTGPDGNCWTPMGGQQTNATDVYGGQRPPTAIDYYRAYQDIVFACIKTICDIMSANAPKPFLPKGSGGNKIKTKRTKASEAIGQDVEEVVDGDLIELLADPNPRKSWSDILWDWPQQEHLFGSGYLRKKSSIITLSDAARPPSTLWIVPSKNTYPILEADGVTIKHYRSGQEEIPFSEIIDIGFTDPMNIYGRGYSPVQACWSTLSLKQKHDSYLANNFDNDGVPCAVVKQTADDVDLSDEENRRTLELDWLKWQTRRKNGGLLIPPHKGIEFEFPAKAPKEIVGKTDELQTIKNAVASAFGIPYALFEVAVGNRATLDASLTQFLMLAVLPRIRKRDEALTKHLARLYDPRMFFRTDSPLPADDEKRNAQFDLLGRLGAVTKNELRAAYPELKLDQRPEFDESPTAPPRPSPNSVSFDDALPGLGQIEEEALQAQAAAPRADQSASVLAIQSAVFGGGLPRDAGVAQLVTLFGFSIEQANALLPLVEPKPAPEPVKTKTRKRPKATEKQLAEIVKRFFEKQRDEVLASVTVDSTKANKAEVGFDLASANVELYSECFPCISMLAEQQIKKTLITVKADVTDYTVISHKLQPTIRKMVLEFADSTNRTTQLDISAAYQKVKESLQEGIEAADSLEAIRKEIGNIYDTASDSRTYAIANTETARVFNTSAQHAAKESGTVRGKTFLVSANACPICQKVAGKFRNKVIGIDEPWTSEEESPYTKGQIPLHPNCKCQELYVLKEEYE